ncbi:MAG: pro-sigmaK processing inhibitor BofA [Clostridia bacterium]|mgnify:CR=1 FL=1|nr:pro-sigmaK processing inhibitor BofA [Clostridia bacterium]
MNLGIIFAAIFLLFLIFLVVRVMIVPIQWIVKILVNSVIALVGLLFLNLIGNFLGFHLPINPVSVLLVAVLGVPGLILLIIMNFLMV